MKKIPVLILNDGILFPGNEYRMETNDEKLQNFFDTIDHSESKEFLIIHSLDNKTTNDVLQFPSIGMRAHLDLKLFVPNSKMRTVTLGLDRVKILHYTTPKQTKPDHYQIILVY